MGGDPEHRSLPCLAPLPNGASSPPPDCILRSKEILFQRCAVRGPLDFCASGTLTRSRPVHSVVWRETPSKRTKEAWAESRAEAGVGEPSVEARVEHRTTEAGVEPPAMEAGIEPASEARHDPAVEARVGP